MARVSGPATNPRCTTALRNSHQAVTEQHQDTCVLPLIKVLAPCPERAAGTKCQLLRSWKMVLVLFMLTEETRSNSCSWNSPAACCIGSCLKPLDLSSRAGKRCPPVKGQRVCFCPHSARLLLVSLGFYQEFLPHGNVPVGIKATATCPAL